MPEHRVTPEIIKNLIKDAMSEFIANRSRDGVGAYVDQRYPNFTSEMKATKEKEVIGRVELAQNIKAVAGEVADECSELILKCGIPHFYWSNDDQQE